MPWWPVLGRSLPLSLHAVRTAHFQEMFKWKMQWTFFGIARAERGGTRAETTFHLSPKWTSPFKSTEASVQSTAGSRGVRISGSNAGYTIFRGSVKSTGYPLNTPVSPSLPPPVRHRVTSGFYWSLTHHKRLHLQWLLSRCVGCNNEGSTYHHTRLVYRYIIVYIVLWQHVSTQHIKVQDSEMKFTTREAMKA